MKKFKAILFLFIIGIACLGTAQGATFNASSPTEIQNAFDMAANNGEDDIINMGTGVYVLDQPLMYIPQERYSVIIQAAGRGQTILDGAGSMQVMIIDTSQTDTDQWTEVTIKSITVQNGYVENGNGGGLSVITGFADVIVEDSSFISNEAIQPESKWPEWGEGGGGGLFVSTGNNLERSGGDITIKSCLFKGNLSTNGSGAYLYKGNVNLRVFGNVLNNIFDNNTSTGNGGGLWVGVSVDLSCINNTLVGNFSGGNGGGVYYHTGHRISVYNNIAWANSAEGQGGDFYFNDGGSQEYINIYNNTFGDIAFFEGNTHSEVNNSNENPLIDASYNLDKTSKCIDSGDVEAPELPGTDFNGNKRIAGSSVDRGAIEHGSTPPENTNPDDPGNNPTNIASSSSGGGGGGCFIESTMGTVK